MSRKRDDLLDGKISALHAACAPTATYLIGVSGGRDSVALLHVLTAHGYRSLVVCHLDHGLREESAEDARFVAGLADRHKLEAVIRREDIRDRARQRRQSLETAARDARYEFFARVSSQHQGAPVFLGHHAEDQVETFLFNLFRGAAPGGLGGMRGDSTRLVNGIELRILRPLLGITRVEIDAHVARNAIKFREDSSNADPQHTRNRVRHELLPALQSVFGRDVRKAILRTAELLSADETFLSAQLPEIAEQLSVPLLRDLAPSLQRRLIHAWLRQSGVPDLSFEVVERVRSLLALRTAKVNLPGARYARRRAGQIFIEQ
jgi:tRNA(Ile)-lysidine synthase